MTLMSAVLTPTYNCAHFTADAWLAETGDDITWVLEGFLAPPTVRTVTPGLSGKLVRLPGPREPCMVLLRRGNAVPHVGLYVRGRLLHLTRAGPIRQQLAVAMLGYTSVRYYAPRQADH